MKLYEYEVQRIALKYEIPIPEGMLAHSPEEAKEVVKIIGLPSVVKAQVLTKGRGDVGGVVTVHSLDDAERVARKMFSEKIKGYTVRSVLIEKMIVIKKEIYFGIIVDRSSRGYLILASDKGGKNIEERLDSKEIIKMNVDPLEGFQDFHARQLALEIGYTGAQVVELATLFRKIYKMAIDCDAELAESNPIIETYEGKFVSADPRIVIDDNALFRHPEFQRRLEEEMEAELSPFELKAKQNGLDYIKLDGDIGIIGNGAGLVMATLDVVKLFGGKPANFLDVGGGASSDRMAAALSVVLCDPAVKGIFINVLGGITRCDEVAKGILEARETFKFAKPIVTRLVGTNEKEGRQILTHEGISVFDSMEEAAKHIVEVVTTGE